MALVSAEVSGLNVKRNSWNALLNFWIKLAAEKMEVRLH